MIKILLASHGNLAAGMLSSLELILGKQENVEVLCAYVDGEDNVGPRVESFIKSIKENEQWIVFTDLFGGSINNEFMKYLNYSNIRLICGMSLPLVMSAVLSVSASDTILEIEDDLKDVVPGIVHFCSELNLENDENEDEEF